MGRSGVDLGTSKIWTRSRFGRTLPPCRVPRPSTTTCCCAGTACRSPRSAWPSCGRSPASPHRTADEIDTAVRAEIGAISRQAVYDALTAFTERGSCGASSPPGPPARYEDRVGDNHHHVICRACGRIADVDCAVGDTPCLTAADDPGYEIDEAEVIYWGRCPDVRRRRPSSGG